MKNILSLVLAIPFTFCLNAQNKDVENAHLKSAGTFFETKMTDKKWSNKNGKSFTSAKYSDYEGVTFVKLAAAKQIEISFQYDINVAKGALKIEIIDSHNQSVFEHDFEKSEKGKTSIRLQQNENYQIRFIGRKTKGSYFCQWIEN